MRVAAFDVGVVNLAYVVIENQDGGGYAILSWKVVAIGNAKSPCEELVDGVVRMLTAHVTDFEGVNEIVIERQMVLRMCVVAHAIQAFFSTRRAAGAALARATMQHAVRKNQCGPWLTANGLPIADVGSAGYRQYKKRAVQDAAQALTLADGAWETWFFEHAKQDDLADALLHALWLLFVKGRAKRVKDII